jgi:hypothetical protein
MESPNYLDGLMAGSSQDHQEHLYDEAIHLLLESTRICHLLSWDIKTLEPTIYKAPRLGSWSHLNLDVTLPKSMTITITSEHNHAIDQPPDTARPTYYTRKYTTQGHVRYPH